MHNALILLKDNWPWLVPILINVLATIANGLMKYPKAQSLLNTVVDLLAWTTRKDSPNTWKLPLARSSGLNGVSPKKGKSGKLLSLPIVAISLFSLGSTSCNVYTKVKEIAKQCGEPAVEKLVVQIIPQVVSALLSNDYSHLLDQLVLTLEKQGVQDALGAVSCAVQSVDFNLRAQKGAALPPNMVQLQKNAEEWLAKHQLGK